MNRAILAAVVIGHLAIAQAVAAEPAGQSDSLPRVAVHYGDLNVDSESGRRALAGRLTRAARSLCPDAWARDLRTKTAGQDCIRKSVADAMSIVGEQRVAQAKKDASQRS